MVTAEREIFTCTPEVKPGFLLIFCSVNIARPMAHRQKRRIPTSVPGMSKV